MAGENQRRKWIGDPLPQVLRCGGSARTNLLLLVVSANCPEALNACFSRHPPPKASVIIDFLVDFLFSDGQKANIRSHGGISWRKYLAGELVRAAMKT
jgi:hypothetical protein